MGLGSHSPHLPQNTCLVTHGPPSVREAHREIKRSQDGNDGRIGGDEVQVATARATVCLGDVATLIVHSDAESEAVLEQEQVPAGATANIDHPHPFRDDFVKEVELGVQEGDTVRIAGVVANALRTQHIALAAFLR